MPQRAMQQIKLSRALKGLLKQQNIRYQTAARWLGLSESSVKRLFSQESLSLEQIETICEGLKIEFVRLVLMANPEERLPEVLEVHQELELTQSPELFRLFYLLFRQWKAAQIAKVWKIPQPKMTRMLLQLEKMGLIDLLPENRVRLLVSPHLRWIPNGPVAQFFRRDVTTSFLENMSEKDADQLLLFVPCELSTQAASRIRRRLAQAAQEIQEIAEAEAQLHKSESRGHGILLALRPWVHPLFVP